MVGICKVNMSRGQGREDMAGGVKRERRRRPRKRGKMGVKQVKDGERREGTKKKGNRRRDEDGREEGRLSCEETEKRKGKGRGSGRQGRKRMEGPG